MNTDSVILISGYETLEGTSLFNYLEAEGYQNVVFDNKERELKEIFTNYKPEYVFLLGDISGGIKVNMEKPAELMMKNLSKTLNIIQFSLEHEVKKLLFLASSCIYPRDINHKLSPEMIMSGHLEPTNSGYATAKIAGIELVRSIRREYGRNFISAISANCFGPDDDFISEDAHVVSSLIRKFQLSKDSSDQSVNIWGTGKPVRDFIYSKDLANGLMFLMKNYNGDQPINLSTGEGSSIKELAIKISQISQYQGDLKFDDSKPDGMPYKVLDNSEILALGWTPQFSLEESLLETYQWYLEYGLPMSK